MNVKINESTQPTEINWDKPQLLIDASANRVVLSTGKQSDEMSFSGTDLKSCEYSEHWLKPCFKPFNGTVTLSND